MSLLEAMSAALPVVATRVGGVGRIVRHEENGLLVSPENSKELAAAIIRLLQNSDEMERLAKNARQTVSEKYSSQKMADEYMKSYEHLVANP